GLCSLALRVRPARPTRHARLDRPDRSTYYIGHARSLEQAKKSWLLTSCIELLDIVSVNLCEVQGFAKGVWMMGVIDEIRMPVTETNRNPILVDTRTRVKDTLTVEPQRRNGRLQLMCYKYIWDDLVADKFPSKKFFTFFP
ncbi:hypothetical protein DVH24_004676, partial [Malus domestica]